MTGPAVPREEPALEFDNSMLVGEHEVLTPSGRRDFEAGMSYFPPIVLALLVLNVGMFIWQLSVGALENEHTIVAFGALSRAHVLDGELWRLVSPMVLHGGVEHLLGNCSALYILGMGCEHGVGGARTAAIYLLTGIGASLASVFTNEGPSVGASGAVFGLMGFLIVFLVRRREEFEVRDKRVATVLVVWAAYTLVTGALTPYIDNAAHLGGLAAGAGMGMLGGNARAARR
ncbi:MAG TPA: rhomboid family intramembrane serine protease [Gemmatimonadaceae bacterium]|jgi:rhomboid protease GluP|nr:rhomboid family intramembrane serine protease [Gemmatimonadaceae bacterium]